MYLFLPDMDKVFDRFFFPWYPEDEKKSFRKIKVKPDVQSWAEPETELSSIQFLKEEGIKKVDEMIQKMIYAASEDWKTYLGVDGEPDIDWVDKFDRYYDKKQVLLLLNKSKADNFTNDFIVTCCEFGAVLGKVLIDLNSGVGWLYDYPYWESSIYDPKTGSLINIFHWAIKKFSNYGIEDGYKPKLLACSQFIQKGGFKKKNLNSD